MSETERFLSRANIHRAVWSLVVALVAFGAGWIYSQYRGKEKVVIATPDEGAKPLVVRVERSPGDSDAQSAAKIAELKAELQRLREQRVPPKRSQRGLKGPESPPRTDELKELRAEIQRLREERVIPKRTEAGFDLRRTSSSSFSPPFVPAFEKPPSVKGYINASLSPFGEASCPPDEVSTGDAVLMQVFLQERVNPSDLTPAIVRIHRRESPTHIVTVVEQQFVMITGLNSIRIVIEVPKGPYELSVGFYARAELAREYPNFYRIDCKLNVK